MNRSTRPTIASWTFAALAAALLFLLPPEAGATPYWTTADYEASLAAEAAHGLDAAPHTGAASPEETAIPRAPAGSIDYAAEYVQSTNFLALWQVEDPLDPEFGGEREAEHLGDIVQSDNTSEVIWVWSHLAADYGIDSLLYRVGWAWTYIENHPAYLEEGGTSPDSGYYRVYNCGWALRAEMEYRRATGDDSYRTYADSCAEYLMQNPLNLFVSSPVSLYSRLNGHVSAWAMGNLYDYGVDVGDATYRAAAAATADSIVTWIEEDPSRLRLNVWAMSGGATMWGLLRSYFAEHPDEAADWTDTYAPELGTWVAGGQFANAWNCWNTLAQWQLFLTTGDLAYRAMHQTLTDSTLAQDGDDDGGIKARYIDGDWQDQTWITNYFCFMSLDPERIMVTSVASGEFPSHPGIVASIAQPNPFRESAVIRFTQTVEGAVRMEIADVRGRRVWSSEPRTMEAGVRTLSWEGRDDGGRPLPAGVYFYRLSLPGGTSEGKLLLTR